MIGQSATVITDGSRCYTTKVNLVKEHQVHIIRNKKEVCKVFFGAYVSKRNAKMKILEIHHHF